MNTFRRTAPLLCALFLLYSVPLYSGDIPFRTWTFAANGSLPIAMSGDMRGSPDRFWDELYNNGTYTGSPSAYPFGSDAGKWSFGVQVGYRFESIPLGLYGNLQYTSFHTSLVDNFPDTPTLREFDATLAILSASYGAEVLLLGDYTDRWATFGKLAIAFNTIKLDVEYEPYSPGSNSEQRFGVEAEFGERFTFSGGRIPLSVEASVVYSNLNLSGKSFTTPGWPNWRTLNDGKDPDDPNDADRTIAFFSLRLGLRYALDFSL